MKSFKAAWTMIVLICGMAGVAQARPAPEGFSELVDKLMPAVVNIATSQTVDMSANPLGEFSQDLPQNSPLRNLPELFEKFYGDKGGANPNNGGGNDDNNGDSPSQAPDDDHKAMSLGSGFIIDADGYIVTNYHVVENAEEITVTLSDDSKLKAKVVGRDSKMDLALLKVEAGHKLPFVKWADSDKSRVGDWVIAIGNPFGLGNSVSAGIISARARDINAGPFDDFIQTDAAINRGNSGGPLFDMDGDVVGINTAIFSPSGGSVGIGFAVPSSMCSPVIDQLRKFGRTHRGWLGVKIQNVSEDAAESLGLSSAAGALVIDVTKGSPADKAGILPGDVVMAFDGHEVPQMRKLPRIVAETKIGKTVGVDVWRKGKKKTLVVTVAELDESKDEADASKQIPGKEIKKDEFASARDVKGLSVVELTPELRKTYGVKDDTKGVLLVKVAEKSDAAEKGLTRGDVVTSVNQEPVANVSQFADAMEAAVKSGRKAVLLLVSRRGETQFIAISFDKKKE